MKKIKISMILNVVNCGSCGEVFAHKLKMKSLTCPYCKFNEDVCHFPDLFYPPEFDDSLIKIIKTKIK